MTPSDFRSLCNHLRKSLELRVHVRTVAKLGNDMGNCRLVGDVYQIRILASLDIYARTMILLHEFAHAVSWHTDNHHTMHGPEFGKAYSRVWRAYLDWLAK